MSSDDEFYDAREILSPRSSHHGTPISTVSPGVFHSDGNVASATDGKENHTRQYEAIGTDGVDIPGRRSFDPVSANIIRRVSTRSQGAHQIPGIQETHIAKDSVHDDVSPLEDMGKRKVDHQKTANLKDVGEHGHRKKSKGFLSRIGLGRQHPDTAKTLNYNPTTCHNNSSSSSVSSGLSNGSASEVERRNSVESNRSALFGNISQTSLRPSQNLPPHGLRYVKIKSKMKPGKETARLIHAQTLSVTSSEAGNDNGLTAKNTQRKKQNDRTVHAPSQSDLKSEEDSTHGAIWTMGFSKDGRYLAAGGQGCVVLVWQVLERQSQKDGTRKESRQDEGVQVFEKEEPIRRYSGHQADILGLCWSKNNFLLSSSMDKTVRLWHVSREECLCVFRHLDIVTSIAFHPKDDRFFLSGSLDCKLRLWNVPEKRVAFWTEMPDNNMVTAVGFTLDGKTACAGSHTGHVFFYETKGLKYNTQMSIKRKNAKKGRKITGIEAVPGMPPGEEKLLVTSNDSRIRLFDMKDMSLMYKYKGANNNSMQIKATFSDDGRFIISGSEDPHVHVWTTNHASFSPFHYLQQQGMSSGASLGPFTESDYTTSQSDNGRPRGISRWLKRSDRHGKDALRNQNQHFEAHRETVTCAIFAPLKTRQMLAMSEKDIIYNNTPILTQNIRQRRSSLPSQDDYAGRSVAPEPRQSISTSNNSNTNDPDYQSESLAREKYTWPDGQIIVSADDRSCIKVWRMDSGVYTNSQPATWRRSVDLTTAGSNVSLHGLIPSTSVSSTLSNRRHHLGAQMPTLRYAKRDA